jgi:hypothetical protein
VRWDPQQRSLLIVVSATSASGRASHATFEHPRENFSIQLWIALSNKHFPAKNTKHFFINILCIESFCPQKTHSRTLFFGSILSSSHHYDYWNQPLKMHMHVCYLHYHEAGLCCYLVLHTENLLRPLQLFYFHLWPIFWLSFVYVKLYNSTRPYAFMLWHLIKHTDIFTFYWLSNVFVRC